MNRTLLILIGLSVTGSVTGSFTVGSELSVLPGEMDGAAPAGMMQRFLMQKVHEAVERRAAAYEAIKTPEQVVAYQQRMRQLFLDQLGGSFPERTPLNARVTGSQNRDGYRIEKVVFESQPRHYVTAILYLPDAKPPHPCVLAPCGHGQTGKAYETYQRACILMAKNGLAVFSFDPIEQGERYQMLLPDGTPCMFAPGTDAGTEESRGVRTPTIYKILREHCRAGLGCIPLGRNAATYFIWDGMRAIDYLQTREDIDPQRIGCAGNSGGGTQTAYLMALDERVGPAVASCWLTTSERLCEGPGPNDAEQSIHGQIGLGMDHPDYLIMRAPKPVLMCTATHDYMNVHGAWDCFRQGKRIYGRLGLADQIDLVETDARHGFSTQLRVAATRWMRRWLLDCDETLIEPDFPILTAEEARCTPRGQVMLLEGARTTYDLNAELEAQLAPRRKQFWRQTEKSKALDEVRRITGIRRLADLPEARLEKTGSLHRVNCRVDKLVVHPEPGIVLPALAFVPADPIGQRLLYVHADGKEADAAPGGPIEQLVGKGHLVLAVDLRDLGETRSTGSCEYGSRRWKNVYLAYQLNTSYLAMWAEDILVCGRVLADYEAGGKPQPVNLVSAGTTGSAALHAAALEPRLFDSITLRNCLGSWTELLRPLAPPDQLVTLVHGALKTYDLPDLRATFPPGKLSLENAP